MAMMTVEPALMALCEALDLVSCTFEPWPFETLLPRIERGRVVLPGDEVGARSYRTWTPADGIEVPVRINRLQIGRFVLVTSLATTGVALSISDRDRALDIAEACASVFADRLTEGVSS